MAIIVTFRDPDLKCLAQLLLPLSRLFHGAMVTTLMSLDPFECELDICSKFAFKSFWSKQSNWRFKEFMGTLHIYSIICFLKV